MDWQKFKMNTNLKMESDDPHSNHSNSTEVHPSNRRFRVRAPPPLPEEVEVTLPAPLKRRGASVVAQYFVKHLLYIRQQIPMMFDELNSEFIRQKNELAAASTMASDSGNGVTRPRARSCRPDRSLRHIQKVTEAVTALLEGLETLYLWGSVLELVITLGSTPINPKEAFVLRMEVDPDHTPGAGVKEGRDAARRLVRELVCGGLPHFNAPVQGPLRLFALACVVPDTACAAGACEAGGLPPGWVPKSGFAGGGGLKLRRCSPVVVTMGRQVPGAAQAADGRAVWVQHTALVKGLPHAKEDAGF